MSWIARALIGPTLWAIAFVVIYALHGVGCAQGWPVIPMLWSSLHQVVLVGTYAVCLLAAWLVLQRVPREPGAKGQVIATGGWIGLGGIALTLFPVLGISSCWY